MRPSRIFRPVLESTQGAGSWTRDLLMSMAWTCDFQQQCLTRWGKFIPADPCRELFWGRGVSVDKILCFPAGAVVAFYELSGFGAIGGFHVFAVPLHLFSGSNAQCDAAEQNYFGEL